jgi:hypothetical protein
MDIFLLDHGTSGDVFHCPFEQNWTVLVNCLDLGCTYALVLVESSWTSLLNIAVLYIVCTACCCLGK